MIYLGVDPGTNILGYATIFSRDSDLLSFKILNSGIINFNKNDSLGKKLSFVYDFFKEMILDIKSKTKEDIFLCLENQFVFKNPRSTFVLISCKTIFILLAEQLNCFFLEIAPTEVKKIISGSGACEKERLFFFLNKIFPDFKPITNDESDALSVALSIAMKVKFEKR
jgi:crossover junction endodeoxyribonuclease RuvC